MKTLTDQLAQYGAYHRDPRNIATHIVGVPMIMLAVVVLHWFSEIARVVVSGHGNILTEPEENSTS